MVAKMHLLMAAYAQQSTGFVGSNGGSVAASSCASVGAGSAGADAAASAGSSAVAAGSCCPCSLELA
jgi:hypothetical protein